MNDQNFILVTWLKTAFCKYIKKKSPSLWDKLVHTSIKKINTNDYILLWIVINKRKNLTLIFIYIIHKFISKYIHIFTTYDT